MQLGGMRLGLRLVFLTSAVFLLLAIVLSTFYLSRSRALLEEALVQRGLTLCRSLSSATAFSALVEDEDGVRRALSSAQIEPDFVGVAAMSAKNKVIASLGNDAFRAWLESPRGESAAKIEKEEVKTNIHINTVDAYEMHCPMSASMASSDPLAAGPPVKAGDTIGAVRLFMSTASLGTRLRDNIMVGALITLIAWIGSIIGTIFLSRSIAGPLERMAKAAEEIAAGDLTVSISSQSADEVGTLGRALDFMTRNLEENLQKVAALSELVARSLGKLQGDATRVVGGARQQKTSADKTFASMNEINRSFEQVSDAVDTLLRATDQPAHSVGEVARLLGSVSDNAGTVSERVDETASAIGEVSASIRQVAQNMDGLSSLADQTAASLEQIDASAKQVSRYAQDSAALVADVAHSAEETALEAVQKTASGMQRIRETVEASASAIVQLEARTQDIGTVLVVINEVTEQVNLLALNASILAAQAGDQGRGFAVVAEEIKGLADRTANSTREISAIIDGVQLDARAAVRTTRDGAQSVAEGVALAERAGEAIGEMVDKARRTVEMASRIEEATRQQTQSVRNIAGAMSQVSGMVKQVASTTQEQSGTASRIHAAAESMRNASQETQSSVHKLDGESRRITQAVLEVRGRVQAIAEAIGVQRRSSEVVVRSVSEIQNVAHASVQTAEQMELGAGELSKHFARLKSDVGKFRLKR